MNIFNSIKFRLQLWYGLLLLAVLMGFGFTAYQLERGRIMRRVDAELHRRLSALAEALRPPRERGGGLPPFAHPPADEAGPIDPNREFRLPPAVASLFDETDTNGFYYGFFWVPGMRYISSANNPGAEDVLSAPEITTRVNRFLVAKAGTQVEQRVEPGDLAARGAENRYHQHEEPPREFDEAESPRSRQLAGADGQPRVPFMRGRFRELSLQTQCGGDIVVGHDMALELAELRRTGRRLVLVGAGILLLGLAGGWWLSSRAIRPIADITSAAQKISTGDLSQRIQTTDHGSELGQLADTLNFTFTRLEASFAQQAQFTSDAAHELRTPVSVILTQAQSALKKERTAAEYRETLEACERAASRMRRLTESLLQLARLDAGQETLRREPFDLAAVAQNCAALITPLAEAKGIKVKTEVLPANCIGDSDRIAQVITNLLNNAINYNQPDGEIRVGVHVDNDQAVLTVADTGVGISKEDMSRVFERFYRGDKSRTGSGNAGLGLAICQAIIEAHNGKISVASEPGRGTTFTVQLPLA